MNALELQHIGHPLVLTTREVPEETTDTAVVRLHAAALNHRDYWITQGQYAQIRLPVILGSDGAGEWRGQSVVIYPAFDWGDNPHMPGRAFRVLGMPEDGTFAEYIRVPRNHLFAKPEHLTWEQAAALPLAGLTAYRVLFSRCQLQAGERVLITGIGGGVALMACQMALTAGAEVFVTSGSEEKIQRAVQLGARGGANYRAADWHKQLREQAGGFDVIVDSAGGDAFSLLPTLCNTGARIGIYGGGQGKINGLSPQVIFWKQISIHGSSMGSPQEFEQMLHFVQQHRIVPIVDAVFPLAEGNAALQRLAAAEQFGKIVLAIGSNAAN
ncbi:MAG: zinc-binding dehydrogenase [Saprospiraceae bacterium]|nr:zinc-binding dehydrogenase [Saprospiraceae bacterium]MDW8228554.1 zinc-binding dehydrogenase [Saprospiraceae bacterium]